MHSPRKENQMILELGLLFELCEENVYSAQQQTKGNILSKNYSAKPLDESILALVTEFTASK